MTGPKPLAVGHYSALFATLPVERNAVLEMIPGGLELGEQSLTPRSQHPILLMFGHHTHVHPSFLKISGWSYHEFLVAVPWVQRGDAPTAYSTMPRLYLDSWPMVLAGWIYAFPKVRARIRSSSSSYEVRSLSMGRQIIDSSWNVEGEPGPIGEFPNFSGVAPTFEQSFIQRFPPLPFQCSVMHFELGKALLRSAESTVTISRSFLPGLPTGTFSFAALTTTPLGSFTISVPWTLSAPKF